MERDAARRRADSYTTRCIEADWQKQWLVERGVARNSQASRHLSDELKARHPEIPWQKVAGIGNVLRYGDESISAPVMWTLARENLPPLEKVRREELAMALAREARPPH